MMPSGVNRPRVLVTQATARLHYGAARALHFQGALSALVTDFSIPYAVGRIAALHPAIGRYNVPLPPELVWSFNSIGLFYRLELKCLRPFSASPHIRAARRLAPCTVKVAARTKPDAAYCFDTQALETFRELKPLGLRVFLEQCVAPRKTQREVLAKLAHLMPDSLLRHRLRNLRILEEREVEEWALADRIVCPSEYVRQQLLAAGVESTKIEVVPYGFTLPSGIIPTPRKKPTLPLRAITVGSIDYRKGVQDLAQIAREFRGRICFEVLGNSVLDKTATAALTESLILRGKQSFPAVLSALAKSDFFILPSYLEGSATATYEALSAGLPCIVSHESGSVVTHGRDGYLFNAGDLDALRAILERIADCPEQLVDMSYRALETARAYSVEQYGNRLWRALYPN